MSTKIVAGLCAALLLTTGWAWTQDGPPFDRRPPRDPRGGPMMDRPWGDKDTHELVQTVMMVRLSKLLELNDEETVLLVRRFGEFREKRMEHRHKGMEMLRDLSQSMERGDSERVIETKLRAHMDFEKTHHDLKKEFFEAAGKNFTAGQRAKLYIFMGDFDREMRRIIQQAREGHRGEGRGPEGGRGFGRPGRGGSPPFWRRPPGPRGGFNGPGQWHNGPPPEPPPER